MSIFDENSIILGKIHLELSGTVIVLIIIHIFIVIIFVGLSQTKECMATWATSFRSTIPDSRNTFIESFTRINVQQIFKFLT